jgi:cytoskeleton protein RodZ
VDIGIGATLRQARNRRKVELSQVEAATRIRVRYLIAIENEDWDVLPGDVYARSFIRTYASYLGLDGERLAEEHRRRSSGGDERPAPGAEPGTPVYAGTPVRSRARGRLVATGVVAALIGVVVAIGLATGDDATVTVERARTGTVATDEPLSLAPPGGRQAALSLELTASAEVWVCLLDGGGRELIDGQILAAGAEEGPFRSGSFTVALGNGEVSMTIDGEAADIPTTSSPVGFSIDRDGSLRSLAEGERPTCT